MATLSAPNSTAVVDVPDELVKRYEAAGWKAQEPEEAPEPAQDEPESTHEEAPQEESVEDSEEAQDEVPDSDTEPKKKSNKK